MNRYEAMEIRDKALKGGYSDDEAIALLRAHTDDLRITTSEDSGPCDDPKCPRYNRLEPVADIAVLHNGQVRAVGAGYSVLARRPTVDEDISLIPTRETYDWCQGRPNAVLARLLEAAVLEPAGEE